MAVTLSGYYNIGHPDSSSTAIGYLNPSTGSMTKIGVRYNFTTESTGGSSFSFTKGAVGLQYGTGGLDFCWVVSDTAYTSISSLTNLVEAAGKTYIGTVTPSYSSGYYTFSINVSNIILLPNTTYYIYIYQINNTYSHYYWNYPSFEENDKHDSFLVSGYGAVVQIYSGGWKHAIPWIYTMDTTTTGSWKIALPWVYSSGWKNTC